MDELYDDIFSTYTKTMDQYVENERTKEILGVKLACCICVLKQHMIKVIDAKDQQIKDLERRNLQMSDDKREQIQKQFYKD